MVDNLLKKYEQFKPFTANEAWGLFRIAAIAEGFGWSLLIFGLYFRQHIIPGNSIAVDIGGQIHGMLFLGYIAAAVLLYPSQSWSRKRALVAGIVSVIPYGSLVFELWLSHKKKRYHLRQRTILSLYRQFI